MTKQIKAPEIPVRELGNWAVERFTVSPKDAEMHNLRERIQAIQGNGRGGREIAPGTYTKLVRIHRRDLPGDRQVISKSTVMSNTPAEISDNRRFIGRARGRVLISGLGLGVVTRMVLDRSAVEHVTVLELEPDVIRLVAPAFQADVDAGHLEIIQADVLNWTAPRGTRWECVWHDIWDNICTDNLEDFKRLRRKYSRRTVWMGFWCEIEHLRAARW